MKTKKSIALLLCLLLTLTLFVPSSTAFAVEGDSGMDTGMRVSKTATANTDGTYTITLEAYATGSKVITEVTEDVPTDIVLVLDQSGSMATDDFPSVGTTTYTAYTDTRNSNLYTKRHNNNGNNGNLYYQLSNGSYATVSVVRTQGEDSYTYLQCPENWQNDKSGSLNDWDPDDYWKYSNNLYVKVGDGYQKVTLTRGWHSTGFFQGYYIYTYTFPDGTTFISDGSDTSPGNPGNFDGKGPLYYLSSTAAGEYTYTYTCTDENGNTIEIGTSTGANTNFNDKTLYYRTVTSGGDITRLQALKNAVTGFKDAVAQKAAGKDGVLGTADDVDHRIAVVGFACSNTGDNDKYNNYQNTEVFIGSKQYKYGTAAQGQYKNALQNMNTTQGQSNVTDSIGALAADGATYVNHGIEMANGILNANPVPQGETRNRVVIVFTDGVPGYSSFESRVANSAITQANTTRSLGANVYAVGIFNGADATSAGNQNGNETAKANWFMQNLSDNKGTPQTPSYYLSAADSNTLNNIFQQIANKIEEGGSATTLSSETVIKDIIAPAFTLPDDATVASIQLDTYQCTGKNDNGFIFSTASSGNQGAVATLDGDKVSVSGFDFAENYVGTVTENGTTSYRGYKLVISFNVKPKAGFLGGNNVYTNTSAGVYENADTENPVLTFNKPQVNVPIGTVSVDAAEKNVYLLGNLTAEQLKSGATVKVGNVNFVNLDLSPDAVNYGLAGWQNEYVTITVEIKDKDGKIVTGLDSIQDDQTYSITVTVGPKYDGVGADGTRATAKSGNGSDNINVFKPVLTFQDREADYLSQYPNEYFTNYNYVSEEWKHSETTANSVSMIGDKPELELIYTPDGNSIDTANKIIATDDFAVNVSVNYVTGKDENGNVTARESIELQHVTFNHQPCLAESGCEWSYGASHLGNATSTPEFLIHVKNVVADLTITKTGLNTNVYPDGDNESAIVTVECTDSDKDSRTWTVVLTKKDNWRATLSGLKVGATYIVTEQTGWTWRYTSTNTPSEVTIAKGGSSVTIENTQNNPYWLGGDNYCVNEFASEQATTD